MPCDSKSPLSRETDAPETIVKLECDIDDASPEVLAYAADRLREAGAREVHWLPLYCKKGRPGWQLQVICTHEDIERLQTIRFVAGSTMTPTCMFGKTWAYAACGSAMSITGAAPVKARLTLM